MASGVEVEREKAVSLAKIASASLLAHASEEIRSRIGAQEAEIVYLQNAVKLAELRKKAAELNVTLPATDTE